MDSQKEVSRKTTYRGWTVFVATATIRSAGRTSGPELRQFRPRQTADPSHDVVRCTGIGPTHARRDVAPPAGCGKRLVERNWAEPLSGDRLDVTLKKDAQPFFEGTGRRSISRHPLLPHDGATRAKARDVGITTAGAFTSPRGKVMPR